MSLKTYQTKRNFKHTPEPKGKKEKASKKRAPEFMIHKHQARRLHYDLRLESEGVLKSWAIPKGPSMNPKDKRLAMQVEDHPWEYRNFEGVIPEGHYGAGPSIIWDKGNFAIESAKSWEENEELVRQGLQKGHLALVLNGEKLKGGFTLARMKSGKEKNAWLLIKKEDEFASEEDITQKEASVMTGKTIDDWAGRPRRTKALDASKLPGVKKTTFPRNLKPMLATLAKESFDDENWIFEIKWDGYRVLAEIHQGKVNLFSRKRNLFNHKYPAIVKTLEHLFPKTDLILDGEIVALDESGRAHFQDLQNRADESRLVFYAFDLIYYESLDLQQTPLTERKTLLRQLLPQTGPVRYVDHIEGSGKTFLEAAKMQGIEGIMAKEKGSPYRANQRTKEWLKIKTHLRQEVVIGGYTEPRKSRKYIGALVLGVYEKGKLVYVGHANAGQSDSQLKELHRLLSSVEIPECPFEVEPKTNEKAHWVKPHYVAEVRFSEWTEDGRMRQPILLGLRNDKDPKEVGREAA